MKAICVTFSYYNHWANRRLYAAAAALADQDYRADRGAFFKSMHGTLNHLLLADRIWMHRFTGKGVTYPALDLILYDDLPSLDVAREEEDQRIIRWVDSLETEDLAGTFTYSTIVEPREVTQPLAEALTHFFNHQTHHRGQAHCLLTQMTGDAPSFDLIAFQRQRG